MLVHKRNSYKPIEVHWSELHVMKNGKQETIKNTSEQQFRTEFECEFLGSVDTLVNSAKLRTMSHITPIQSNAGTRHI